MAVAAAQRRPQVPETFKPAMMGMYIFLASEVMFFGSLFAMYFYMLGSHPFSWPPPAPKADFYVKWYPIPAINTVILLSSAVPAHFAQEAIAENKRARFFWLLVLTIVLGCLVLLALILGRGLRGQFSGRHHVAVRAVVLYWHFVDVVWIFLFTILYLGVTFGQ